MGIFSGLFKSRDKPTNSYDSPSYTYFFGRSNAGKRVTDRTALQHIAVYACVRVLSEAIAQLPLHVYKYNDKGKERVPQHPLYFLLHDQPNPEMTSFVFRETLMSHLLIYGNAYAQIIRNGRGDVIGLYPLMPNKMKVDRDEKNRLIYIYSRYDEANPNLKEQGDIVLYADEVLHIPGLGYDGLVGYSPIALAKNAIGISIACEDYGASFFGNNANPSGVLEHPGVIKNPDKLRDAWHRAYGGRNAHKVAVLEEGVKFTPISIPNNEAQFLETRKFQIEEIARMYRVPLHMIGDLDHATFSNVEHLSLDFVKYSLDPWIVRWEQGLQKALLSDSEKGQYFIKFNVDGLLRGDYASRMQGYSIGIQNGFLCPNDVRELEDMNLIPEEKGGFTYMVNGSMSRLCDAGIAYADKKEESENG
ncbi:phage portal protein [uncultured Ruminococcus sp.]|uniref:phage portal protein n=1 Tax=uncultured Ruminococcus sp. TaxID=165186 RepID=UPI0026662E5A|nr:phage portal protein [uncultured Ruminococcus sp.]